MSKQDPNTARYSSFYRLADKHRLIYKESPGFAIPEGSDHVHIPEGLDLIELFTYSYKITTYSQLVYHLACIRFLNPDINEFLFQKVAESLLTEKMDIDSVDIEGLYWNVAYKPKGKTRKFFFRAGLSHTEKMLIVNNRYTRRRINQDDIYEAIIELDASGKKISYRSIGAYLKVSHTTIQNNITNELKEFLTYSCNSAAA